jgi:hypothetical protein
MGTYADQLAEVRKAITRVLTMGQSTEIQVDGSSRTITRANLESLNAREKALIPLAAQETRSRVGRRVRQIAPG